MIDKKIRQIVLVLFFLFPVARPQAYVPFVFPSGTLASEVVYDVARGALLPAELAIPNFLCTEPGESISLLPGGRECGDMIIYLNTTEFFLTYLELLEDGSISALSGQPNFQVTEGVSVEQVPIRATSAGANEAEDFGDGASFQLLNLPPNNLTSIEIGNQNATRRVFLVQLEDPSPPTATFKQVTNMTKAAETGQDNVTVTFLVQFSTWVVKTPKEVAGLCPEVGGSKFERRVLDGALQVNSTLWEVPCTNANMANFSEPVLREMVSVAGVSDFDIEYLAPEFTADTAVPGARFFSTRPRLQISAELGRENKTKVEISVARGAVMSFYGAENVEEFRQEFEIDFSKPSEEVGSIFSAASVQRAQNLGTTVTTLTAVGVSTAVTTSVGVAVASSASGTVAGSAAGGSMAGASNMLNEAQKIFLVGQLALASLPEVCQAFAGELEWTMFNFPTPWEDKEDADDSRQGVKRALFWSVLFLTCLLILHCTILILMLMWRVRIPGILRFPRIELYFGYWAIPAITLAAAGLFKSGKSDRIMGGFLLAIFPGGFLLLHVYVLWHSFYHRSPERYNAIAVFEGEAPEELSKAPSRVRSKGHRRTYSSQIRSLFNWDVLAFRTSGLSQRQPSPEALPPQGESMDVTEYRIGEGSPSQAAPHFFERPTREIGVAHERSASLPRTQEEEEEEEEEEEVEERGCMSRMCGGFGRLVEMVVWTPLLGPPYEGAWTTHRGPRSMFYSRFGPMFEEFRGKPMNTRHATYIVDPETHQMNRGEVRPVKMPRSWFVSRWEESSIGHHLQVSGKVLDIFKLVFIAALISGEDEPESLAQLVVLVSLSSFFLVMLRVFRPPISRWDLGMAMLGEVSDIATFSVAIVLLAKDMTDHERRVTGTILLVLKVITFLAMFLDTIFFALEIVQAVWKAIRERFGPNPKMLAVVMQCQRYNPRYLMRKYFNRWVLNSLGRKVYTGSLKPGSAPFEEVFWEKHIRRSRRRRRGLQRGINLPVIHIQG